MINQNHVENLLELEVYTQSPVQVGRLQCPGDVRVLDLLNNHFAHESAGDDCFIELLASPGPDDREPSRLYFRKSAIEIIALGDPNTARGIGAIPSQKTYPFVNKMPRRVTLDLNSYSVTGSMHCANNQSVSALLNERKAFLPLTEAVIMDGSGFRGERPFIAVNRHAVISLREDRYFHTS